MLYTCPTCERQLISRSSPRCVFCGAVVPDYLRFTPEERAKIEASEQTAQDRERIAAAKEAELLAQPIYGLPPHFSPPSAQGYCCPACNRQLISRSSPRCVFCSAVIPEHLLFTKEQRALIAADEQRSRDREAALAAKQKKAVEEAQNWMPPSAFES